MSISEQQRAEERAALDRRDKAFKRHQQSIFSFTDQLTPHGNGDPSENVMAELKAAEIEWETADAEVKRITAEITSGARR